MSVPFVRMDRRRRDCRRCEFSDVPCKTDDAGMVARMKKPGAVSRPGALRQFVFPDYNESGMRVQEQFQNAPLPGPVVPASSGTSADFDELE
jgi:hypothetical protein